MRKRSSKKAPPSVDVITGIFRMHPRGFGFVAPDDLKKYSQDIFIPKHLTDNAVDGDHVEVVINPDSNWEKGPDGKITSILHRGRTHIAGIVSHIENNVMAHVPICNPASTFSERSST